MLSTYLKMKDLHIFGRGVERHWVRCGLLLFGGRAVVLRAALPLLGLWLIVGLWGETQNFIFYNIQKKVWDKRITLNTTCTKCDSSKPSSKNI